MTRNDLIAMAFLPHLEKLPTPVYLRTQQLQAGEFFPIHSHGWNQFVYSTVGSLVVQLEHSRYLITPMQGIWLPSGTRHTTGTLHRAAFRNLYIDDSLGLALPSVCQMYSITPLLRQLVVELNKIETESESQTYIQHLHQLLADQLCRLPPIDLYLPWPHSHRLQKSCEAIYQNPSDSVSMEDWGMRLGASSRTLTRHFEKEVGMTLRDWRGRLRLFRAIEWLENGAPITQISIELGYASASAFSYMFRCNMGCSPSQWLKRIVGI